MLTDKAKVNQTGSVHRAYNSLYKTFFSNSHALILSTREKEYIIQKRTQIK